MTPRNTHGHVTPNADGSKARCGGPIICATCQFELAQKYARYTPAPAKPSQEAKAAPAEVPYALRQWAMDDEPESTLFDEGYNAARGWVRMQLEKPAEPTDVVKVPRELLRTIEQSWRIPNGYPASVSEEVGEIIANGLKELRALLGGAG